MRRRSRRHHSALASSNGRYAAGRDGRRGSWRLCQIRHILCSVSPSDKPLVWLRGEVKTPPFSPAARVEAGGLLRRLQRGERLGMPHSRPVPGIGRRCHELRIGDAGKTWRIVTGSIATRL